MSAGGNQGRARLGIHEERSERGKDLGFGHSVDLLFVLLFFFCFFFFISVLAFLILYVLHVCFAQLQFRISTSHVALPATVLLL